MCKECEEENKGINLEEFKNINGFNKITKPLGDKPYEDLSGKKFYKLVAVKAVGRNKTGRILWLCECECSNKIITTAGSLKGGKCKSCGCLHKIAPVLRRENLEGKVFTRWTVIKDEGGSKVLCRCLCGTERWVDRGNLRGKVSKSCGCLREEELKGKYVKNLCGMRFGRLTVLEEVGRDKYGKALWKTVCDCGNVRIVSSGSLLRGHTTSCGCLKRDRTVERCTKPMIGKTFGRLTVLEKVYAKKGKGAYYRCLCSCGNVSIIQGAMLRSGNTLSCGCLLKESRQRFNDLAGQRFGKLLVLKRVPNKGKGHETRFLCQCDCGGTTIVSRYSLLTHETMSCGCINSQGEYKVAQILKENGINFEKQKTYKDLRTTKFGAPKFDFYITEDNYLIEYDGQQHFSYSDKGWNTKENFEKVKARDELKNKYCREHNIPLIRIPYTQFEDLSIEDLKLDTTKFRVT